MKRKVAWVAAVLITAFGALGLRVVLEGRAALADGDAALADKRPSDAIAAWESAARWYLPGASHVDEAYQRLTTFATTYRSAAAWRSIRSAARATETLWQPHAADLAAADAALVTLAAADPERSKLADTAWYAEQLARDPHPGTGSIVLAILGLAAWLVGIGLVLRRPTLRHAAISAAGLAAWALGVYTV